MGRLKALLIGVNDYSNPRPTKVRIPATKSGKPYKKVMVDPDLPGARVDVANMCELLERVAPSLAYEAVEGVVLTGAEDTTQQSIRNWLAWLGHSAAKGDQLVLYFSGHSAWVQRVALERGCCHPEESAEVSPSSRRVAARPPGFRREDPVTGLDVALCPSDTTWDDRFVTAGDLLGLMRGAFARKACLEIVLETCSAGGIAPRFRGLPRNYFGQRTLPRGLFARWDAARLDESSHSAPVPACTGEVQGLFTRFFKDAVLAGGTTRDQVLQRVQGLFKEYWAARKRCCSSPVVYQQTPNLTGPGSAWPFGGTCQGERSPAEGAAAAMTWVYGNDPKPEHI